MNYGFVKKKKDTLNTLAMAEEASLGLLKTNSHRLHIFGNFTQGVWVNSTHCPGHQKTHETTCAGLPQSAGWWPVLKSSCDSAGNVV